jgi:hypothetical protein
MAMSDPDKKKMVIGETEQILLDYQSRKQESAASGSSSTTTSSSSSNSQRTIQEYCKTVRHDGLDGVRAIVWSLLQASEVVFPVLGVLLTCGLFLNLAGYGYYMDDGGMLIVSSLKYIQQEQYLQLEATKLAVGAAERAALF